MATELSNVPLNPGNWSNAADIINENSSKINTEFIKLENATTKFKGFFTSLAQLQAAWPSPIVGDIAWIGPTYPGTVHDVVNGQWHDTTVAPSVDTVNLSEYSKLLGNEEFTGIKKMARGLELKKGFVAYGQDTLLTGVGRYVAAYVSPTFGSRILSYDGVNYYDLVLGAYVNGKFGMTLKENGEVAFGHLKQTTGNDPEQVMSQDAVSKEFASVRSEQKALSDCIIETGNSNTVALLAKNGIFYSLTNVATLAPQRYGYYELKFIINDHDSTNQVILDLGSDLNNWWGIRLNNNGIDFLYYGSSNEAKQVSLGTVSDNINKECTIRIDKVIAPNPSGDALYVSLNGSVKLATQSWKDIDFIGIASLGALYNGALPCTNVSFLYFNIYDRDNGTYTLYNSSTITDLSSKLYSIKDTQIVSHPELNLILDSKLESEYKIKESPYLHTNGSTSKLRFSNYEGITTSLGRLDCLLKLPTNVNDNRILFSWGSSFMVSVNLGELNVYNVQGGGKAIATAVTDYAGQVVLLSIRKLGDVNSPYIEIWINGKKLATSDTYSPETNSVPNVDIGSYNLGALFCDVDFYFLRKYNSSGEPIWEVNPNKVASVYQDVALYIGNTIVNYNEPDPEVSYLSTIPSTLYVTSNKEYNLYIDNLIIDYSKLGMSLEVKATDNVIRSMDRNIRFNMPNVGTISLLFTLFNSLGNVIEQKTVALQTVSPTSGTDTKQFLFVGDSTIDDALMVGGQPYYGYEGPQIVHEFYDMCNSNKGFTPLMIGHKRDYPPYYHAGMGGWSSSDFLNSNSPFWYNGKNDFRHYVQEQIATISGAVDRVDFMIYQIGINDLKNESISVATLMANVKTFVDQFLAEYPDAKVVLGIPASGCDATGWSFHFFDISRFSIFRKKMIEYQNELLTTFDNGAYNANVFVCNAGQMVDRIYGFPYKLVPISNRITTEIMQHWDSVHPNESGYNQMADAYFARIKSLV